MKRRSFLGGAVLAAAVLVLPAAAQAQETLRFAGSFAAGHSSSKAMEIFKDRLAALSGGALAAELSPGLALGGAKESVDAMRAGTIFGVWVGVAGLSRLVPEVDALSLPFLFDDRKQAMAAIDGPVGRLVAERLAAKGFAALGWMELGLRHVTNSRRPLKTIEDFKGLRLRVQPNQARLATFRAIGASPVPLDVKELYGALQQGVVEGQENPYSVIEANRYWETQKYLSDTGHVFDFIVLMVSKPALDALPAALGKAVIEAAGAAIAAQRKIAAQSDAAALAALKARGMQFDAVPPETRAALRKASASVIEDVRKRVGADLVDAMLAAAGKR